MKLKPILFNTEMVRAILEGRKTVTRRVMKPQPADTDDCQHEMQTYDQMLPQFYKGDYSCVCRNCGYGTKPSGESVFQPPYRPGDILYVRETFFKDAGRYMYKANYFDGEKFYRNGKEVHIKWTPSIHMPREAARIFLRVTDVRVERLQETTGEQCVAEGLEREPLDEIGVDFMCGMFHDLWDSTIKPKDRALYGWEANPWVWVIGFERIEKDEI